MPLPEAHRTPDRLQQTGLSQRAINRVRGIGEELARYGQLYLKYGIPPTVLALSYLAKLDALQQVQPDAGLLANLFNATPFIDIPSPDPTYGTGLNTQLAASHVSGQLGLLGTAGEGIGTIISMNLSEERKKRGEAKNPYRSVALTMEFNRPETANYLGDLTAEMYALLDENPNAKKEFIKTYGHLCPLVKQTSPIPLEKPADLYFRSESEEFDNAVWLKNIVRAQRSTIAIINLTDPYHAIHAHTIPDLAISEPNSQETVRLLNQERGIVQNTVAIMEKMALRANPDLPEFLKIVVVNDGVTVPVLGYYEVKGTQKPLTVKLEDDFRNKDYSVFVAERECMDHIITQFIKNRFRSIVLSNDGSPEGYKIMTNWKAYYEKYKDVYCRNHGITDISLLPAINTVDEEKLGQSLKTVPHDAVFLIGPNDKAVARAARDIIDRQNKTFGEEDQQYLKKPLICLMEGRTATAKIEEFEKDMIWHPNPTAGDYYISHLQAFYVHRILAKRIIEMALRHKIDWADEKIQ